MSFATDLAADTALAPRNPRTQMFLLLT